MTCACPRGVRMSTGPADLDYRLLFEALLSPYLVMTADFTIVRSTPPRACPVIDLAAVAV